MIKHLIFIFLGGGLGSILRFLIAKNYNADFAYGTFFANIIGCLCIGLLLGLIKKEIISENFMFFSVIGFCGGLTTFSSFAWELFDLLSSNSIKQFLLYICLSVMLGILCVGLGFKLSQIFT